MCSVGGESLAVAQNTYTVSWFKGRELNTVFGLMLSMARIGSTVNFLSMEPIYNWVATFSEGYTTLGLSLVIGEMALLLRKCGWDVKTVCVGFVVEVQFSLLYFI